MTPSTANMANDLQRTEAWFTQRRGRITASMVGAILGSNPWMGREDAMRTLVRDWHGAPREFSGNVATQYGEHHEAGALMEYQMETGNAVTPEGFVMKGDWAGCSPDGLIGLVGGIEIKCPYGKRHMDEGDTLKTLGEQPHYHDQVQFSLWVCERAWWDFYQWAPPAPGIDNTRLERVLPCSKWRTKNLPKLHAFWEEYLVERELPAAQKHLDPKRIEIDTPEMRQRLAEYDDLVEAIEQAEARKKELLASFVEAAKERSASLCGRNLTRVERAGSVAYAKVVKEHLPKLDLEPYRSKPSEYWMLK